MKYFLKILSDFIALFFSITNMFNKMHKMLKQAYVLCVCNCAEITQDFLAVLEKCPSKMRKKLTNHKVVACHWLTVISSSCDHMCDYFVMHYITRCSSKFDVICIL